MHISHNAYMCIYHILHTCVDIPHYTHMCIHISVYTTLHIYVYYHIIHTFVHIPHTHTQNLKTNSNL